MAISPGGRPADASGLGKPGSPRGLSDYTREIANALIRKGMPKSKAIAIARASEAKRFSHSKNPAIATAAVAAVAQDHVLDHRKKGRRDLSNATITVPAFSTILVGGGGGVSNPLFASTVDLDWAQWNQEHQGQQQPPAQPDLLNAQTHNNIAAFQKAHGLPVTGQLDPHTVTWLNDPKNSAAARAAATGAAKKTAATQTKAAKKAAAAAKKATAAQAAEAKKSASAQAKAAKAQVTATKNAQTAAVSNGKNSLAAGKRATASLSVPIIGNQDGARMTNVRALNLKNLKRAQKKRTKKK